MPSLVNFLSNKWVCLKMVDTPLISPNGPHLCQLGTSSIKLPKLQTVRRIEEGDLKGFRARPASGPMLISILPQNLPFSMGVSHGSPQILGPFQTPHPWVPLHYFSSSTASKKTPKALSGTPQYGHPPGRTPRVVRDHFLLRCHGQVWALRSFGTIAIDHLSPILMLIHLIHSGKS